MAIISNKEGSSVESSIKDYFKDGLYGPIKQDKSQINSNKLFNENPLFEHHHTGVRKKSSRSDLLAPSRSEFDNYVERNLNHSLIDKDALNSAEYSLIMRTLAEALEEAAKMYPAASFQYKTVEAASKLAAELERIRSEYQMSSLRDLLA